MSSRWDDPPLPDVQLDAARTERNSAVAEAKLWLHRYQAENKRNEALRREVVAYAKALKEWQAAYDALLFDFNRLQHKHGGALADLKFAKESEAMFIGVTQELLKQSIA